jgi:hypothetical protein
MIKSALTKAQETLAEFETSYPGDESGDYRRELLATATAYGIVAIAELLAQQESRVGQSDSGRGPK